MRKLKPEQQNQKAQKWLPARADPSALLVASDPMNWLKSCLPCSTAQSHRVCHAKAQSRQTEGHNFCTAMMQGLLLLRVVQHDGFGNSSGKMSRILAYAWCMTRSTHR